MAKKSYVKKDVITVTNAFGPIAKGRDCDILGSAVNNNAEILKNLIERIEILEKGKGE